MDSVSRSNSRVEKKGLLRSSLNKRKDKEVFKQGKIEDIVRVSNPTHVSFCLLWKLRKRKAKANAHPYNNTALSWVGSKHVCFLAVHCNVCMHV